MNQENFALALGICKRAYTLRIAGQNPDWRISELIKATKYSQGKCSIKLDGKYYDIAITERTEDR